MQAVYLKGSMGLPVNAQSDTDRLYATSVGTLKPDILFAPCYHTLQG